jgi:glycosyltransferase involved in cell wall biosynthesis
VKILLFSTLYPNAGQPHHGIFVENRLRHLLAYGGDSSRVVAPVPWFPSSNPRFGRYATYAGAPRAEVRHGIQVDHPRYPVVPKVGMSAAPGLLYLAARAGVRRLLAEGFDFDLIDAHYIYPDGVAAALLAREFGRPFVMTGRGTDLKLIPRYALPRRMIRWAADRADGLITVGDALAQDLAQLGVARERVRVLRNGVDLKQFVRDPARRAALRAAHGLAGPVVLSVGNLIDLKGHHLAIRAIAELPGVHLLIAGTGPRDRSLRDLAQSLGVAERVTFLGSVPHGDLKGYYAAADALVLASSREGWPNVLLESLACGTPVVATAVDGSLEVVQAEVAGCVVGDRRADAIARGLADVLARRSDPAAVRAYAEAFSWDATSAGQRALFAEILAARGGRGLAHTGPLAEPPSGAVMPAADIDGAPSPAARHVADV